MKKIDTHGLKMIGLKKASGETENYGSYSGKYNEVFYDLSTGDVWTRFQFSLGRNSWTAYNNQSIIKICDASEHLTMQEIADLIAARVQSLKA